MIGQRKISLTMLLSFVLLTMVPAAVNAGQYKVLVVFSYEEDFYWTQDIKEGVETVLAGVAEIEYFYMDTKTNLAGGAQKAEEAYQRYNALQPDGVITADDNAQHMFVVPYLKDKVATPVMFSGVNAEPEKYGFPAKNVSGILERGHIRESISFLKQFAPQVSNIAFVAKNSPSGQAVFDQAKHESDSYAVSICDMVLVNDETELIRAATDLKGRCDALYIDGLGGINSSDGKPLRNSQILSILNKNYAGPVLGANKIHVDQGALSAVVKTGQEQGQRAAEMLLQAMKGTPVADIPVTRNFKGRRIINVTTMKTLGIQPRAITLRGAELVRTQ
ncbi:MAG: ABC transporter substrate binding protein [Motiliproteus sp.]